MSRIFGVQIADPMRSRALSRHGSNDGDSLLRQAGPSIGHVQPDVAARDSSLTLLGLVVTVCMFIAGLLVLWQARTDTWTAALASAQNLRLILNGEIAHNLQVLDLSIQGVQASLSLPGIDEIDPVIRHHALFDASIGAEDLDAVLVMNKNGDIVEDSTSLTPHKVNLSDRDYFKVFANGPEAGKFISRPFNSRISNGELRIALCRRMVGPDGRFAGVVGGALRLDYFRRIFDKIDVGPNGAITLLRDDGRILYRYPFNEQVLDRDMSEDRVFRRIKSDVDGHFVGAAGIDGKDRLQNFGRVAGFPLILAVGLSVDDVYASWNWRACFAIPILCLLVTTAFSATVLFSRELRRRRIAEGSLRVAARELQALAATDPLTGLNNRRAFDLAIDREWRQSIRERTPFSLLMIDVDAFKAYNDLYGHLQGDQALRAVAHAIERGIGRATDVAARLGGEEFGIFLPNTGVAGAETVAERIRSSVQELRIAHNGSQLGCLTVSIGAATFRPSGGDAHGEIVAAADAALYVAKQNGRNQVRSSAMSLDLAVEDA